MKVLDAGHRYLLDNLMADTKTEICFYKDSALHGGSGHDGPSCQEYLRALIDRVKTLDGERHWCGNVDIIHHLRMALAGFEARAIIRHVEKDGLAVESVEVSKNGHFTLRDHLSEQG